MRLAAGPPRPARAHTPHTRAWRASCLLAAAIAAVTLAACSATEETASRSPTTSAISPDSTAPGSTTATTARPVREYPGGGPVDRVFPPDDHAYELLVAGSCAQLLAATDDWGESVVEQIGQDTLRAYRSAALACEGR